jgi:hypothetical protein
MSVLFVIPAKAGIRIFQIENRILKISRGVAATERSEVDGWPRSVGISVVFVGADFKPAHVIPEFP